MSAVQALWHKLVTNWATTIPGGLALICGSVHLAELLPETYGKYLLASCGFLLAIGVIGSKAQGVSNAPHPVAASVVTPDEQAIVKPVTNAPIIPANPNTSAVPKP